MRDNISPLVIGCLVIFISGTSSAPITFPSAEVNGQGNSFRLRSDSTTNATNNASIYICQNQLETPIHAPIEVRVLMTVYSDWCPPCLYYPLGPDENDTQLFWMAPAPGGPGPWDDVGNYTVGSWGPSPGVITFWRDEEGNYSQIYEYPGTGQVDDYWKDNIWTFYAIWDN